MQRYVTLNLEPLQYSNEAKKIFENFSDYVELNERQNLTKKKFWNDISQAHIIITRLSYELDKEFFDKAKNLKVVVTPTTGLNHINLKIAEKKNIKIISLKGETDFLSKITSTAELAFSLILELTRKTGRSVEYVKKSGLWERDNFRGTQLKGKRIGIVGLGRLGRMILNYSLSFGMSAYYYDINDNVYCDQKNKKIKKTKNLNFLLRNSDIVTLHVNYNEDNHHLISYDEFDIMRERALFINTSRGELVNENALLCALKMKKISGAALDVISDENKAVLDALNHPLISFASKNDNLIISPHIGGACSDAMEMTEVHTAKMVHNYLNFEEIK